MCRYLVPLVFGVVGTAILLSLGIWQLQRLAWKRAVLAQIETQIAADPVPIFSVPFQEFQAVSAEGLITGPEAHVLTSQQHDGVGFRIISVFETADRRILLDRGYVPQNRKSDTRPPVRARITANFRTVAESDGFTPPPDLEANYWFARDIPALAETLNTEPVLIILRETSETEPPVRPAPVTTQGIANDHLQYAVTWFAMAIAWAGMTAFLLWRIRQSTD